MPRLIAILTLAVSALTAQTFEVASVRRSSHGETSATTMLDLERPMALGRVEYFHVNLKTILMAAYGVGKDQIAGPSWLNSDTYDILAELPAGAKSNEVPAMLQNLLAERFRMIVREETGLRRGFALIAQKGGPAFTPSKIGARPDLNLQIDRIEFGDCTIDEFARVLAVIMGRPIADRTGIEGNYDITLKASRADLRAAGSSGERSSGAVPAALRALGLRLEPGMIPAPYINVEKADRFPTEN